MLFHLTCLLCVLASVFGKTEEIRLCKCEEQDKCFGTIVSTMEKCHEECAGKNLKSEQKEKVHQCYEMRKTAMRTLFECVNRELAKGASCASGKEEQKLAKPSTPMEEAFVGELKATMKRTFDVGKDANHSFAEIELKIAQCTRECVFGKVAKQGCFDKEKCAPKVNEQSLKSAMGQCAEHTNLDQGLYEGCTCLQKNGIEDFKKVCEKSRGKQGEGKADGEEGGLPVLKLGK